MRRVDIDLKAHAVVFQRKTDHSATFGEARGLANREYWQSFYELHNLIDVRFFRCADEQNFAILQVLQIFRPFVAPDDKSPLPDFFVYHQMIEDISERI